MSTSTMTTTRSSSQLQRLDHAVPPLLRPLIRAYLLGYASTVAPRLATLLVQHLTKSSYRGKVAHQKPQPSFQKSLQHILHSGLEWQRFPTFCATLIGGSTLLEVFLHPQLVIHKRRPSLANSHAPLIGAPEPGIPGLVEGPLCSNKKEVSTRKSRSVLLLTLST